MQNRCESAVAVATLSHPDPARMKNAVGTSASGNVGWLRRAAAPMALCIGTGTPVSIARAATSAKILASVAASTEPQRSRAAREGPPQVSSVSIERRRT